MRNRKLWKKKLEIAEKRVNFHHGYKLVFGPWKSLKGLDTVFLSQMPSLPVPKDADWRAISEEKGNTFEIELEIADSPYNMQFMELAEFLGRKPKKILTGVATPFRITNWNALTEDQLRITRKLGKKFWTKPLLQDSVKLIVVIGQETCDLVRMITDASADLDSPPKLNIPANLGRARLRRYHTSNGKVVIHLPDFARNQLFTHEDSEEPLRRIFDGFIKP